MKKLSYVIFLVLSTTYCQADELMSRNQLKPLDYSWTQNSSELSVMSYNVENLFDTLHDEGKLDHEYLPLKLENGQTNQVKLDACNAISLEWRRESCLKTDWSQDKLNLKFRQIEKVLRLQGGLPDILALQEVENASVVSQLLNHMGANRYDLHISNSLDVRGIDNAIVYNKEKLISLASGQENIYFKRKALNSRPILWAVFKVKANKQKIAVLVNHWPSQAHPAEERVAAAKTVKKVRKFLRRKYFVKHAIVMGDFNTTAHDRPHPIINYLDKGSSGLVDSRILLKQNDSNTFYRLALGTSFYSTAAQWDYLDKILVSKSLLKEKSKLSMDKASFRILAMEEITKSFLANRNEKHSFLNKTYGVPKRYDFQAQNEEKAGFSDHFPVRVLLKIRN